jgi:uncharacterized protein
VAAAGESPTMGVVVESRADAHSTSRLARWLLPDARRRGPSTEWKRPRRRPLRAVSDPRIRVQARSIYTYEATLTTHVSALLLRWNGQLRKALWWSLWWGSLDGMQGIRPWQLRLPGREVGYGPEQASADAGEGRMAAKFVLKKGSTGKFRFNLVATNGQVIATSEAYESKASAIKGIESVKRNAPMRRSTTRPTSSLLSSSTPAVVASFELPTRTFPGSLGVREAARRWPLGGMVSCRNGSRGGRSRRG